MNPVAGGYAFALMRRQCLLAVRRPIETANPLLFFALVSLLFPLGIGPEPTQLARFAPGIFWIIALLSTLLAAERWSWGHESGGGWLCVCTDAPAMLVSRAPPY